MRKFLLIATFLAAAVFPRIGHASIFNINLNTLGGQTGFLPGPCYCGPFPYYLSPILTFAPGDTVHFGTVTIFGFGPIYTPDAGPNQLPAFGQFNQLLLFGPTDNNPVSLAPAVSFGTPIDTLLNYDFSFTFGSNGRVS
jgi:hypothetical protein